MISIDSKKAACAHTCRAVDASVVSPQILNGSTQ